MKIKIIRQGSDIVAFDESTDLNQSNMSHLQDEMTISYKAIESVLGVPNGETDGYKVSCKWQVITPHGIATIYDWKTCKEYYGEEEGIDYALNTDWHIGGHNRESAAFIKSIFIK